MPSYHGKGYAAKVIYSYSKDPTQEAKNYLREFLKERREAAQADPSIKTDRRITQCSTNLKQTRRDTTFEHTDATDTTNGMEKR